MPDCQLINSLRDVSDLFTDSIYWKKKKTVDEHSREEIFAVGLSDILADFDRKADWKKRWSKSSWCNFAFHYTTKTS